MTKSPVVRLADSLGTAVGTFQKSLTRARYGKRPPFLEAWADDSKWELSDATARQAQRRAVQNSWVFVAISTIARGISSAKFQVSQYKGVDEKLVQIPNHPFEEVLRRPNPFMGGAFLWQYTTWWLELNGNSYWFVAQDRLGQVSEIWPLPSEDVEPVPGNAERFIDHYEYRVGGRQFDIPAEYVVHIKLPNPFDIFRGMSPLKASMMAIDTDLAMSGWNAAFFGRDNVMPSAIINLSSGDSNIPIDAADVESLKSDLKTSYSALQRRTAITSVAKLDVELLSWSPKDLDFVSGRQFTKEEIYEIYGIPGGLYDKNATYANSSNAVLVLNKHTIWPLLGLISEQLTAELMIPFYGKNFVAGFDDIREGNRELQMSEIGSAGPYLTIDEVRERFYSLPPLPEKRGGVTMTEAQSLPAEGEGEFMFPEEESELPLQLPAPRPEVVEEEKASLQGRLVQQDLRRWKTKAVTATKRNKSLPVDFQSDVIPSLQMLAIRQGLSVLEISRARKSLLQGEVLEEVRGVFEREVASFPFELKSPKGRSRRPWDRWEGYLRRVVMKFFRDESRRLTDLVRREGENVLLDDKTWIEHQERFKQSILETVLGMARLGVRHGQSRLETSVQGIVDWELVNEQARDWADQYSANLVTKVTETTKRKLRDSIRDWVEAGETLPDLEKRILETVGDPKRAKVIAQTESTSVYAEGNAQAWEAAGISSAAYKPPAHVGCRCYLQPHKMADGTWVMVWYTVRDSRVCVVPIQTPWGTVKGCKGLHRTIVSRGPHMGKKI